MSKEITLEMIYKAKKVLEENNYYNFKNYFGEYISINGEVYTIRSPKEDYFNDWTEEKAERMRNIWVIR